MSNFKRFPVPLIEDPIVKDDMKVTQSWEQWFFDLANIVPEFSIVRTSLDVANVAANTVAQQAFTIANVLDEDDNSIALGTNVVLTTDDHVISVTSDSVIGVGISNFVITDDNELTMDLINPTGSGVNPAAATYTIIVIKG